MIIRVPASSANLGPGFDTLGMALSLHAEAGVINGEVPAGAQRIDQYHPATIAFRRAGGDGDLWISSPIPVGRGLGFSGAVRIAGIVAAHAQQHGSDPDELSAHAHTILSLATELEGHADNVAASLFGGIVATADGRAVRIPLPFDPAVVVWIPSFTTSTDESRTKMGNNVPLDDAVFNIGRVALLVAALASGDTDALRSATQDRLHQDRRLAAVEPSKVALDAALDAGAWCSWLSGSGPTVAAMCPFDEADDLAAKMPDQGHTKVLRIDHGGAVIESDH
ncbi:MAG TPA: homoserine kinase [Ilumatobacteraceae bacterium]